MRNSLNISLKKVPFSIGEQEFLGNRLRDRIEKRSKKFRNHPKFFYEPKTGTAFLVNYRLRDPKRYKNVDLFPPSPLSSR